MRNYEKIITSYVASSSTRMLIGASSTVYMLISHISLYEVGLIKSLQAILILLLGFVIGIVSDRVERKSLYLIAIFFSSLWLFIFYLAGVEKNFNLFLLAETLNAISLTIFQNNANAYLVDQYLTEKPGSDLSEPFGKLGKYDFFFMAIFSLVGGILYQILSAHVFWIAGLLMMFLLFVSWCYLPKRSIKSPISKTYIDKRDFLILWRKFKIFRTELALFVLFSLYFQILIQYWQVVAIQIDLVKQYEFILGIVLFAMFIAQSLSGKYIESGKKPYPYMMPLLFILGVILALLGEIYHHFAFYMLGIFLSFFIIRYTIIKTDTLLHAKLLSRFRAKYDMLLNSIVRVLTAIVLVLVGYLSEYYSVIIISFIGLALSIIFILMTRLLETR